MVKIQRKRPLSERQHFRSDPCPSASVALPQHVVETGARNQQLKKSDVCDILYQCHVRLLPSAWIYTPTPTYDSMRPTTRVGFATIQHSRTMSVGAEKG